MAAWLTVIVKVPSAVTLTDFGIAKMWGWGERIFESMKVIPECPLCVCQAGTAMTETTLSYRGRFPQPMLIVRQGPSIGLPRVQ